VLFISASIIVGILTSLLFIYIVLQIRNRVGDLDRYLAILGIAIAALLILWLSLTTHKYIEVGITLFLSCGTYLILRKHILLYGISSQDQQQNGSIYVLCNLLFFPLFIYSVIVVIFRPDPYIRPLGYFISTALMVAILAIEILYLSQRKAYAYFILIKISLIALSLICIPQFIFPGLIGSDAWAHQMFTTKTLTDGIIPEGYSYSHLPIMHLLIGATSLMTGLSYKFAAMFSVCFLQIIGLVSVFLLGRFIFNLRVGLLAALLLGTSAEWIPGGIVAAPWTFSMIIVILLIYMIFLAKEKKSITFTFLILVLMVVLILSHTMTALCMAILLLLFWFGFMLYKQVYRAEFDSPVTYYLVTFFTVAMLAWWIYGSKSITTLKEVLQYAFRVDIWSVTQIHTEYMQTVPYYESLLNLLGFLLLFAFSIVGSFYMLSSKFGNRHSFVLTMGGLVLIFIGFFGLAQGLSGIIPHRWWYYSIIVMAIPAAIGVFLICYRFKSNLARLSTLVLLMVTVSFFSVTPSTTNFDNPIYSKNTSARSAFTQSEISAMDTISRVWEGVVGVNTTAEIYYFSFIKGMTTEEIAASLYDKDFTSLRGVAVIINKEVESGYFEVTGGGMKLGYSPREILQKQGFSQLYNSSGGTSVYLKQ